MIFEARTLVSIAPWTLLAPGGSSSSSSSA